MWRVYCGGPILLVIDFISVIDKEKVLDGKLMEKLFLGMLRKNRIRHRNVVFYTKYLTKSLQHHDKNLNCKTQFII